MEIQGGVEECQLTSQASPLVTETNSSMSGPPKMEATCTKRKNLSRDEMKLLPSYSVNVGINSCREVKIYHIFNS